MSQAPGGGAPGGPGGPGQTPGSMLEIYMHALANKTSDDFLDSINMGVGNYSEAEYWQQVESFRNGLYADAAMTKRIVERAKLQAQKRMVDAVFEGNHDAQILKHVDMPEREDDQTKREYLEEHMEDVWEDLGVEEVYSTHEHQAWIVHLATGIDMDWTPPHWRMLKARHEASRSKDARLLDNLFGRPPEPDPRPMEDF